MALTFVQKCKAPLGGRAFRAYEIISDGETCTIDASDLDLTEIENVWLACKNDLSTVATVDFAEIADAAFETTNITVTDAALGDYVMVACEVDLADLTLTGFVQAAGKVDLLLTNESGGAVNIAEKEFYIKILKRVGFSTQTGPYLIFWPPLTSGDKFTIWVIGY